MLPRQRFDERGRPTPKRAEPIAADFHETGDGKRLGKLKLVTASSMSASTSPPGREA